MGDSSDPEQCNSYSATGAVLPRPEAPPLQLGANVDLEAVVLLSDWHIKRPTTVAVLNGDTGAVLCENSFPFCPVRVY